MKKNNFKINYLNNQNYVISRGKKNKIVKMLLYFRSLNNKKKEEAGIKLGEYKNGILDYKFMNIGKNYILFETFSYFCIFTFGMYFYYSILFDLKIIFDSKNIFYFILIIFSLFKVIKNLVIMFINSKINYKIMIDKNKIIYKIIKHEK